MTPRPDDIAEAERRIFDEWYATAPVGARLAYWQIKAESGSVVAKASWWLPGTFAPCLCPHQGDGESCCSGPDGNMCCHGCAVANGPGKVRLAVSYRQPFRRRRYGLSTYDPVEAMRMAEWMVANGRRRVRIKVEHGC